MKHTKFLKNYLWTVLVIGILGILDAFFALFNIAPKIYLGVMAIVYLAWFIVNILAITIFIHNRLAKLTYVLPIYYIITFMILTTISIIVSFSNITSIIQLVVNTSLLIGSIFEIVFSLYLIKSFNTMNS